MFATGFCSGIIAYFILQRVVDVLSFRAGKAVGFNCDKCAMKCTGVKCYAERLAQDDIERSAQEFEDGEILDVPSEDHN